MNPPRLRAAFAMDASLLLEQGAANDAALLCVSGLGMYPDYLGGYVLLSQAYDALQRPLDARIILEEAQRRFPSFVPPSPLDSTIIESETADIPIEPALTNLPLEPVHPILEVVAPVRMSRVLSVEPPRQPHTTDSPLRIIDTAQITDDTRIIRSASVRLIPGLEFTTLRFEGTKTRGRREIQTLSEPPPFRRFHPARRVLQPAPQQPQLSGNTVAKRPASKPLSLEELASRLERARMPRSGESANASTLPTPPSHGDPSQGEPSQGVPSHGVVPTSANMGLPRQQSLVTETIARIYMQQGAYDKAIDAFTALSVIKPEKNEEYQSIIAELTAKLNS